MSTPEKENNSPVTEYEWMIRPCEMYKDEYSDCTSIKGRFHQYFIHGESVDCAQWKRDLDNCVKWTENHNEKAGAQIIESEKHRRHERLKAHYSNNVWERRIEPPTDWNKSLPEGICRDYEMSYLGIKAKEMRGEAVAENPFTERTLCSIM